MGLSKQARKAMEKARKEQKKRRKRHWFFLQKGDRPKEIVSKVITQISALVLVVCMIILFNYFKAGFDNTKLNNTLQSLYGNFVQTFNSKELSPNAKALLEINPDTVGWIKINDTKIDLPVVLHPTEGGNEYYLARNFNGGKAKAGTVFADYRNVIAAKEQSDNIILYGHNEADNTMFGDLDQYKKNPNYYKEHPLVQFNSNYGTSQYKIFAYFVTNVLPEQAADKKVFDYQNYIDMDKARYQDFIDNIMLRTQILTDVDVQHGDKFLTLSTCSNEFEPSRFVVVARKLRDGEQPDVNTALTSLNKNAKEPDWDVIYKR